MSSIGPRCFSFVESVFSMSWEDRAVYSTSIEVLPYLVDAKHCSLARRPRLWWFNWAIRSEDGVHITLPGSPDRHEYGEIRFEVGVEASRYRLDGLWRARQIASSTRLQRPSQVPNLGGGWRGLIPAPAGVGALGGGQPSLPAVSIQT